jgi:type II secretory pathway pseudopilin PulG
MPHLKVQPKRRAFTFVELLIVLGMVAIVVYTLTAALMKVREVAARTQCQNNIRHLSMGTHAYNGALGHLPPTVGWTANYHFGSVFFLLAPYIESNAWFNTSVEIDAQGKRVYLAWNLVRQPVKYFSCPSDSTYAPDDWPARGSYVANYQVFKEGDQLFPKMMPDGPANTIMFTERLANCGYDSDGKPIFTAWMWWHWDLHTPMFAYCLPGPSSKFANASRVGDCDPHVPASPHGKAGIVVAMGDVSTRIVSPDISGETWWAACTPAAGDVLGGDW